MALNRVLVTAVGGNIGQGIIKALRAGTRDYHIVGIDMSPLAAGFSLVDQHYSVPRTGSSAFGSVLGDVIKREKIDAIYVCSPTELPYFSSQKEVIEKDYSVTVFINPENVVRIGSDKLETALFLRDAGFPYPDTVLASDGIGVARLIDTYGWPLVVKPRWGSSSKNVFTVQSLDEIKAAHVLVRDLVVQRYLPDDNAEYTAGTISDLDKKVRATIVLHRDLSQGTTYRTELYENRDVTDQVERIVEALGAVGACNLQFRLVDGKVYVFEINPRFSGTSGVRYCYGFNDPEMVFELIRMKRNVSQPALVEAVALRYWNEIVMSGSTFDDLREVHSNHCGKQAIVQAPAAVEPCKSDSEIQVLEERRLDGMADKYFTQKALGPDCKQMEFIRNAVLQKCSGPKVLELGCGNGGWTQDLVDMKYDVTVVDGSEQLIQHCRARYGKSVKAMHSLFEEYETDEKFNDIFASCILEHVKDPIVLLTRIASWLAEGGRVHVVVPNALSLHRRVGMRMGLLDHPMQLSAQELEVGHRRSYTSDTFRSELERAKLHVNTMDGIFLKPLSSGQMMDWSEDLLDGYNQLSDELSEYTAFLYGSCETGK